MTPEAVKNICPIVRATGFLVDDGKLLVVKQSLRERSNWTLPGGMLEFGETLEECLVREMQEETGMEVEVDRLLYICDRFKALSRHVVDVSFLVHAVGGSLRSSSDSDRGSEHLPEIKMVPFDQLESYGFSQKFAQIAAAGFPSSGSYQGDFHRFFNGNQD